MPTSLYPQSTRYPDEAIVVTLVIEVQPFHRGPSCWGFAYNPLSVQCPCKVLSPTLLDRVKQGYVLAGYRVSACRKVVTPFIASTTRQREIIRLICPSMRSGKKVVQGEACRTDPFRRMAIFASSVGSFADGMLNRRRDAHSSGICSSTKAS